TTATGSTTSHTYNVAGQYTVLLLADDHWGGKSTDNLIITVKDVLPSIRADALVPSATTVAEGQSLTLDGSFVDPNPNHSATVSIDWGDRSPVTSFGLGVGERSFSHVPHQYLDNPTGCSTY